MTVTLIFSVVSLYTFHKHDQGKLLLCHSGNIFFGIKARAVNMKMNEMSGSELDPNLTTEDTITETSP